jgi:hypothetical protein
MNPRTSPRGKSDEIFSGLVSNALDFLKRSNSEFEKHPKYSLIHFCASVEIFVKARLMREHWTLIVTRSDKATWGTFQSGIEHSVGLGEAHARLKRVAEDGLTDEQLKAFESLVKHRNRLIHFHHEGLSTQETLKAEVAASQLRAWFYIHQLLTTRWRAHFELIQKTLERMERSMRKRRPYLRAKFEGLKERFAEAEAAGLRCVECPSCGFESLVMKQQLGELSHGLCLVCDWYRVQLAFECPNCGDQTEALDDGFGTCDHCGKAFDAYQIAHVLEDPTGRYRAWTDGDDSGLSGNCILCEMEETVVPYHGRYLCTNCFDLSDERHNCPWCGAVTNYEVDMGVPTGCFACAAAREEWYERN